MSDHHCSFDQRKDQSERTNVDGNAHFSKASREQKAKGDLITLFGLGHEDLPSPCRECGGKGGVCEPSQFKVVVRKFGISKYPEL